MKKSDEILDYCRKAQREVTAREIIESLYPGKEQPYINSVINELVYEKRLVRNDSIRPYRVRLPFPGEIIGKVRDYSRGPIVKTAMRTIRRREDIITPCKEEIEKYLSKWQGLDKYKAQENALNKLFFSTYPKNTDIDEVLVKVATLNDFYSTNIFSAYKIAQHIIKLNIDERLEVGDDELVNDLAQVMIDKDDTKNFYSFATKYCSHHRPFDYAIYDSYVQKVLCYFRNVDRFSEFSGGELKNYPRFKSVLKDFIAFYGLEDYNLKLIDRYLWQLGKDKFPKYSTKKEYI